MINYFIRSYGCQANVAESQAIANHLAFLGCQEVNCEALADLIVINTCAVREKAEQKLWSYLGRLADIKRKKPFLRIGIIGCVASYKKQEIYQRFDHVAFVFGAREDIAILHAYLADAVVHLETAKQLYDVQPTAPIHNHGQDRDVAGLVSHKGLSFRYPFQVQVQSAMVRPAINEVRRSFVNIMTGCNKYCSYCIVPFTRGREISYPMSRIIDQVRHDVLLGAKEVTLIGQNVNSYKDPETGALFPELLRSVAEIEGDFWIRFMSPHPYDMTRDLFEVMALYRPKITACIHFPVQAGSDRILSLMNRHYTVQEYEQKIGWIRELMPDAMISTDVIVGFPGETAEDFEHTMSLIERVRYDLIYAFVYSSRKFTKASAMVDDCSHETKLARFERLVQRQTEIAAEQNSRNIGKTLTCLVEKRLEHGKLLARTEGSIRVLFDGSDDCIGTFVKLHIDSSGPANMYATVVNT